MGDLFRALNNHSNPDVRKTIVLIIELINPQDEDLIKKVNESLGRAYNQQQNPEVKDMFENVRNIYQIKMHFIYLSQTDMFVQKTIDLIKELETENSFQYAIDITARAARSFKPESLGILVNSEDTQVRTIMRQALDPQVVGRVGQIPVSVTNSKTCLTQI